MDRSGCPLALLSILEDHIAMSIHDQLACSCFSIVAPPGSFVTFVAPPGSFSVAIGVFGFQAADEICPSRRREHCANAPLASNQTMKLTATAVRLGYTFR
jgi:hypothetical protein